MALMLIWMDALQSDGSNRGLQRLQVERVKVNAFWFLLDATPINSD